MTTQLQFLNSSTLLTSSGPRRVETRHEDAKYEMKIVNELSEYNHLFVLPWARQVIIKADGTKTETLVQPRFEKTLVDYLIEYEQKYPRMSVARLVLARAVHEDIGEALRVLKQKGMEHHGLAPCAIFMFKENLRLGLLEYVCFKGDSVDLSPIHSKTIPEFENSLDKITERLRGPVPAKELASFLEANGVKCNSWLCADARELKYTKASEASEASEDDASEDEASEDESEIVEEEAEIVEEEAESEEEIESEED